MGGHHVRAAFEVPLLHEHVHVPAVLVACPAFRFPQMLFEHVGHHHLPVFLRTVGDQPADAHVLDAVHAVLREHLVRQGPWACEFRMPPVAFLHGLQVPPVPRFEVLVLPDHFLRVFHRFRPFLMSWFPAADPVGKRLPRRSRRFAPACRTVPARRRAWTADRAAAIRRWPCWPRNTFSLPLPLSPFLA